MPPHAMSSASISFGLVTVPVRVYAATQASAGLSFHLLHAKDGVRLRQQLVCPEDGEIVPRKDAVKGYEFEKDRFVTFREEELKALDENTTRGIEIEQFVPLSSIDPAFYERTYYLSPDKGGDRAFALLARALEEMQLAAIGQYAVRGKDHLVAVRPSSGRLVMHQLLHQDEVRPLAEVPAPEPGVKEPELRLARQLIEHLRVDAFEPARFADRVRARVRELIERKVAGEQLGAAAQPAPRAQVIDLMEALKASLERKQGARPAAPAPAARASRTEDARPAPRRGSRAPRAARRARRTG